MMLYDGDGPQWVKSDAFVNEVKNIFLFANNITAHIKFKPLS